MNIYKGRRSCYYRREGILITHDWEIPDMIMRDLRRRCGRDHVLDRVKDKRYALQYCREDENRK